MSTRPLQAYRDLSGPSTNSTDHVFERFDLGFWSLSIVPQFPSLFVDGLRLDSLGRRLRTS